MSVSVSGITMMQKKKVQRERGKKFPFSKMPMNVIYSVSTKFLINVFFEYRSNKMNLNHFSE